MKKSVLMIFGNFSYALANWFILFYFIKLESIENLGLYGLVLSITTPLIVFLNFQIRSLQAIDINKNYNFYDYNFFRLFTFIVGIFFIIVIAFLQKDVYSLFLVIAIMKLIDSLSEVNYGLFQQTRKIGVLSSSKVLKSIIIFVVIGSNFLVKKDTIINFEVITIGFIAVYLMEILYVKFKMKIQLFKFTNKKILKDLFVYGFPLMIATFLGSINSNLPRYFLGFFESVEKIGYYTAFVYIISVGNLFVSSVAQVYISPLAKIWQNGNYENIRENLKTVLIKVVIVFSFIFIIISLFSDIIIEIFFGKNFLDMKTEFIMTLVAAVINYIGAIFGYFNVATKRFKSLVKVSIVWIIFTALSSIIFIPLYGLNGAFITLIISNIVILITRLILLVNYMNKVRKVQEN